MEKTNPLSSWLIGRQVTPCATLSANGVRESQKGTRGGTVAGLCEAGVTEPLMILHQRRRKGVLMHTGVTAPGYRKTCGAEL